MKYVSIVLVVLSLILIPSLAHAIVLFDEYDPMSWYFTLTPGSEDVISVSDECVYSGDKALKIVAIVRDAAISNYSFAAGDLSAERPGYIELAFKSPCQPVNGNDFSQMHIYLGTDQLNTTCWAFDAIDFEKTITPCGWYEIHLEFDSNGDATTVGGTINGSPFTPVGGGSTAMPAAWTDGTVDWTNITYMHVGLYRPYGSGTARPFYLDQITMNEPLVRTTSCAADPNETYGLGILEDEYTGTRCHPGWAWRVAPAGQISVTTEDVYTGGFAMRLDDPDGQSAIVKTDECFLAGDQSSRNTSYLEVAFKTPHYAVGQVWLAFVDICVGSDRSGNTDHVCWLINASQLEGTADENGWYLAHLELDGSGEATLTGTTLNGVAVGAEGAVWKEGVVDWENINMVQVGIREQIWAYEYEQTYYVDAIRLGSPIVAGPQTCTDALNWGYFVPGDLNSDCRVKIDDFQIMATNWLKCIVPDDGNCDHPWE